MIPSARIIVLGLAGGLLGGCAKAPAPVVEHPGAPPVPSNEHVALGIPKDADPSDDLILDHHSYVLSYNPRMHVANWVAWHLDERDLGSVQRAHEFLVDDALPIGMARVTADDYAQSGYDRGHLCPSADRTDTAEHNARTFLMTNVHPQRPELNRVPWKALEEYERSLAKAHRSLYIVAGCIFSAHPVTIGHGVAVPRLDYKIVVVLEAGQTVASINASTLVFAAMMPNEAGVQEKPWAAYLTTVDAVESASGYDFLTALTPAVQAALESKLAAVP